jgi:hypothetical protein
MPVPGQRLPMWSETQCVLEWWRNAKNGVGAAPGGISAGEISTIGWRFRSGRETGRRCFGGLRSRKVSSRQTSAPIARGNPNGQTLRRRSIYRAVRGASGIDFAKTEARTEAKTARALCGSMSGLNTRCNEVNSGVMVTVPDLLINRFAQQ